MPGPPNFIFLLVDDLGWRDLGSFGSAFHDTPNIDGLAAGGVRFTQAYTASPVCSPTRASILTGKHPARLQITDWIGGSQRGLLLPAQYRDRLPLEEVTLAEALREAGYATGYVGKWHLGDHPYFPEAQGFDSNVGGHGAGHPVSYFSPYRAPEGRDSRWDVPGLEGGEEGEYLTDRLTDEALAFIGANGNRPFLLYFAYYSVHTPIQAKPELEAKYAARGGGLDESVPFETEHGRARTRLRQDHPAYAGMVESVDESVGRMLSRLEELGISENTIVFFMSDNGGLSTVSGERVGPTSNVPLRAGKGWLYEGGIRVPLLVRWPGRAEAGIVSDAPVLSTDFYPTILQMAGLPARPEQHLDGRSLVPLLSGAGELDREALHFHFPHYHGSGNRPSGAIRVGDLKLVEWFEDGVVELYDLAQDPGEREDLAPARPGLARDLHGRLEAWRLEVGAQMPQQDPDSPKGDGE
jgi:arylsulfatase A-like enzyme